MSPAELPQEQLVDWIRDCLALCDSADARGDDQRHAGNHRAGGQPLGSHADAEGGEVLGLDAAEIAQLRDAAVI